jgi:hypothetical protein
VAFGTARYGVTVLYPSGTGCTAMISPFGGVTPTVRC